MLRKKRFIRRPVARNCFFCKNKIEPSFLEVANLAKYISERGKIVSKTWTGVCTKHQRHLSKEIKRARHLALLPYIVRA